jgi:hypothetical protein
MTTTQQRGLKVPSEALSSDGLTRFIGWGAWAHPLEPADGQAGRRKVRARFSAPNPEPMHLLEVSSGAAGIELENLANANFSEMRLSGGAAGYEPDFGGMLSRAPLGKARWCRGSGWTCALLSRRRSSRRETLPWCGEQNTSTKFTQGPLSHPSGGAIRDVDHSTLYTRSRDAYPIVGPKGAA